ncbi:keto-hydroxyglutarate-aldolase/keto-deoxy- phosphogluconate aldolase [Enterococcus columbae DSM 7374 = ATCC 51263]|nr:keto-hydroxyglutarate-aldolase/keto-deoxy- phosphogluconate aldolase [Enterococcus columbae DSM 7374 = ATCC 51263]
MTEVKKVTILQKLEKCGVIAVVRGNTDVQAIKASEAIIEGGITGIELTFTVPNAEGAIKDLIEKYQKDPSVVVGAGTVLDATTARIAIMAGAQFIVSPSFDIETAKLCNLYQIPYLPGCMTVTEMKEALEYGADIVKLFPGSAFGSSMIRAFKAPLPQLNIMPTGGVNLENMEKWFKAGAVAVGIGGNLLAPLKDENYPLITEISQEYIKRLNEIRG